MCRVGCCEPLQLCVNCSEDRILNLKITSMILRVSCEPVIALLLMVVSGLPLHGQTSSPPIESTDLCFTTDENYIFDAKIVSASGAIPS